MKYVNKMYSNRRIHLGLIARCNRNEKYGLLYGFRKPPYMGGDENVYEHKLLYFEKELDHEISENTLVYYLSYDYNGFTPMVEYAHPLSSLVVHRDERSAQRANGVYHDDETWRLINEGIPYIDFQSGRNCVIYMPLIENGICTVWEGLLGNGIYVGRHTEWLIYELYNELTQINYTGWPSLEEVTNIVSNFSKQVDSFDANAIIDTFQVTKIKRYVSRPGRDDNYFEILHQCLPDNEDVYLSYLLPTKQEDVFYDDNAYPSDGYSTGIDLMMEETQKARDTAKKEYTKEKHLAFLINDYFANVVENKERTEFLNNKIKELFGIENARKIANIFQGDMTEEFRALMDDYNQNTVVGLLEVHPQK